MTTTSTITFSIGIRFPRLIVSYDLNLVIFICLKKSGCTNDKTKEYKMPSYYFYYYFLLLFLFVKTSYLLLYKVDFRRLELSFCVSRLSRHKTLLLILSVRLGHMTRITHNYNTTTTTTTTTTFNRFIKFDPWNRSDQLHDMTSRPRKKHSISILLFCLFVTIL